MTTTAVERTRRAILIAAIRVLSANQSASMREVADEAQVARSTVHRYYPDRATLLEALTAFVTQEYEQVIDLLRGRGGTGLEVLLQLVSELYDNDEVFGWWFVASDEETEDDGMGDDFVVELVARGHADGSIDPAFPAIWIDTMIWSLLYAARVQRLQPGRTRGEVRTVFLASAEKVLRT